MILIMFGASHRKFVKSKQAVKERRRRVLKLKNRSVEIENKLSVLGMTSKYGENPNGEVEKIEEAIGLTLPMDYKRFLHKFGTLNFNDTEVVFSLENTVDEEFLTIVNFYGLMEITLI